jgi:DNA-binding NarL/FixJ family response regulator
MRACRVDHRLVDVRDLVVAAGLTRRDDLQVDTALGPRRADTTWLLERSSELSRLHQCIGRVLLLLAEGLRNTDIADRLMVSCKTVEHHVSSILRKLDVRTRGQAAAAAARLGLRGGS